MYVIDGYIDTNRQEKQCNTPETVQIHNKQCQNTRDSENAQEMVQINKQQRKHTSRQCIANCNYCYVILHVKAEEGQDVFYLKLCVISRATTDFQHRKNIPLLTICVSGQNYAEIVFRGFG